MKNIQITLQPLSLIVGAGLLGIMLITTGAFAPQGTASARDITATEDVNSFNPKTAVRITSDAPYTVPAGKLFVLTSNGKIAASNGYFYVLADGVYQFDGYGSALEPIANGPTYSEGTVVSIDIGGNGVGVLYGYLVDA